MAQKVKMPPTAERVLLMISRSSMWLLSFSEIIEVTNLPEMEVLEALKFLDRENWVVSGDNGSDWIFSILPEDEVSAIVTATVSGYTSARQGHA